MVKLTLISQNCTKKVNIVFHAPFMQELSELEVNQEEIEILDTLQSSDKLRMKTKEQVPLQFLLLLSLNHLNLKDKSLRLKQNQSQHEFLIIFKEKITDIY